MTDADGAARPLPFVALGPEKCRDGAAGATREWWLANGIGGYAGGTVSGVLTRRYHGLLVAPLRPPLGRLLMLAKADAVVIDGGVETPVHTNHWADGSVEPQGYRHLESFHLDAGMPVWRFALDDLRIEQRIWMVHGENRTYVAFKWVAGERAAPPRIRLDLLASYRDHHHVSRAGELRLRPRGIRDGLRLELTHGRAMTLGSACAAFTPDHTWIERFFLARERERGLEDTDNHLRIGRADLRLARGRWVGISIAVGDDPGDDAEAALHHALERPRRQEDRALPGLPASLVPPWVTELVHAADAYLVRVPTSGDGRRTTVIAGYPWFGDWGRDALVALPGLTLATGRPEAALEVLEGFTGLVSEGMVPNLFPGDGAVPEYNTVDAALWLVEAWRAWLEHTLDRRPLAAAFPVLAGIVAAYREGTRYGIALDPEDGLLRAGAPGWQLTWMDARVEGRAVTPRHGKAVEVNALWHNALASMASFARVLEVDPGEYSRMAAATARGFERFQRGDGAGLYDVLDGPAGADDSIRPNQILAVSLPFTPLASRAARAAVVKACRARLLTPYGLRSLDAADPRYAGRYEGGVGARDGSYHQGPVWGWLLGHYALAEYRVGGDAGAALEHLAPMAGQLLEAGLGHIGELFDGDPPHLPRGAPAQAWSVACTLEAWWRLTRAAGRSAAAVGTPLDTTGPAAGAFS